MVWRPVQHESGKTYYYNDETQQSVWEKPLELLTPLERALQGSDWREYKADNGREYYYNVKTQESVWEVPQDIQKILDKENEQVIDVEEEPKEVKIHKTSKLTDSKEKYHNDSALLKNEIYVRTPEDGEKLFIELLRENSVDATWSFSKIMDEFITDPRYWCIEDSLHKKQVFENYLATRTKEELIHENMSVEKFKTAFINLLKSKPEIKYYTRWKTTKRLLQDESIYVHSVISEKVKRQTFHEYVDSLRLDHDSGESKLREQALGELTEYFKSLNLSLSSTWQSTVSTIKQDSRFEQNKHFKVLTQLDLLTLFEHNMMELQKDYKQLIKDTNRLNYRSDRKSRDGFRELLGELKEGGLFRADSKWQDIYELMKEDDRFIELLGRNGSNPVELFQDAKEEEEVLIKAKQVVVEQVLVKNGVSVKDDIDMDEQLKQIMQVLEKDEQTKEYDSDTIELIYLRLVRDVKEQKERDRFAKERALRRSQEDFKTLLRTFANPVITFDTKWEDIKLKLENEPEYRALPDDQTRFLTFDKFIHRLAESKIAMESEQELDVKRIIENVAQAKREATKKRPRGAEPSVDLDY
jgi:pre-mRNA-processing factor 40